MKHIRYPPPPATTIGGHKISKFHERTFAATRKKNIWHNAGRKLWRTMIAPVLKNMPQIEVYTGYNISMTLHHYYSTYIDYSTYRITLRDL